MINYLSVENFKGRTASFGVKAPFVLIKGEMGSGKSAVIEGLLTALGLPTRYGSTNLGRLSPTGSWAVSVGFDHDTIRTVTRSVTKGKGSYSVNGVPASGAEYANALAEIIDLQPHHVDLGQFLQLSGQRRAEMFSRMLEDSVSSVAEAIGDVAGLSDKWGFERDVVKEVISRAGRVAGDGPALVEGLKQIFLECQRGERTAKAALDESIEKQSALSHGAQPSSLKARVKEIDERLGALKEQIAGHERDKERYESASKVVQRAEKAAEAAEQKYEETKIAASAADDLKAKIAEIDSKIEKAKEVSAEMDKIHNRANAGLAPARADVGMLETFANLHKKLADVAWDIDKDWLREHANTFLEEIAPGLDVTIDVVNAGDAWYDRTVAFIREGVAEALDVDSKLGEARKAVREQERRVEAAMESASKSREDVKKLEADRQSTAKLLDKANEAGAALADLKAQSEDAAKAAIEAKQEASRTAPPSSTEVYEQEMNALNAERSKLSEQLTELEEANAIAGRIEQQRLDVHNSTTRTSFAKSLLEQAQHWRDSKVRGKTHDIIKPFANRFEALFGEGSKLVIDSSGTGRGTQFSFSLDRGRGIPVDIELLSDGELVLAGAAFLGALQEISTSKMTMLAMTTEALSEVGLMQFVRRAPALAFDAMFIANNRGGEQAQTAETSGWQIIDMDNPPRD